MRRTGIHLLVGVALAALVVAPAQAATVSASGPLTLTVSGAETAPLGVPYPVMVIVTNATPDPTGADARVSLGIPLGAQLQGAIVNTTGAACARVGGGSNGALVICPVPGLVSGGSATISFSVVPQTLGVLGVSVGDIDGGTTSGVGLVVPVAPAPTDVQVTGSASTGSPALGSTFTYTYQVKDNGPWPAPGVTFSDTLPSSLELLGVTSSVGTCSQAAGTVSCALGDLPVGGQANVSLSVQAPPVAESVTDTASAAMADGVTDRQPANNAVSVTVQAR
jgi:uncharacterized repeat protein (TIGR01451 family)